MPIMKIDLNPIIEVGPISSWKYEIIWRTWVLVKFCTERIKWFGIFLLLPPSPSPSRPIPSHPQCMWGVILLSRSIKVKGLYFGGWQAEWHRYLRGAEPHFLLMSYPIIKVPAWVSGSGLISLITPPNNKKEGSDLLHARGRFLVGRQCF